ncbi:MAG: universal stress protein [Candidatus Desulfofervidaceae bacterium]|nr:universal stress protein [Candidatus Desulfofervidaceae bacterium]MDL1971548.1 universal stress protein [Candidatus Desulfofervidaceae bacterium]
MFKKVLTATDLLEACDAAVLTALEIAKQNNAKLYILHVLESPYSGKYRQFVKDFRTGEEIVASAEYEEAIKEELDKKCAGALKPYGTYEIKVVPGFPWVEILRWARKESVDLIVLGPHAGRAEEKGVVRVTDRVGSTVEGVIMRARCPVMIVNQVIPSEKLKFKKVLICIDFSKTCEYAFESALKLTQKYQAKLHTFHMLPVPQGYYTQSELENEIKANKERIKTLCKEMPEGIEHECAVWEGTLPYVEILKYAREKDVDLIIMGSHTKEKDNKWYLGSAVEQVSLRAHCPVLVVTHPKAVLKFED